MFTWPNTLPSPSNDFSSETQPASIYSRLPGAKKVRLRFRSQFQPISISWNMTDAQYAIFRTAYYHHLSAGTQWFNIALPMGNALTYCVARFSGEGFSAQRKGCDSWMVKASLDLRDSS